jgi:hypothetical protein
MFSSADEKNGFFVSVEEYRFGASQTVMRKSGNKGEKIQNTRENVVMSLIVLTVYQTYCGDQIKEDDRG